MPLFKVSFEAQALVMAASQEEAIAEARRVILANGSIMLFCSDVGRSLYPVDYESKKPATQTRKAGTKGLEAFPTDGYANMQDHGKGPDEPVETAEDGVSHPESGIASNAPMYPSF